uniref:DNA helicase n=1 Tax=Rhizophora mucronata TaxID=61149 RepID=A0A2P2L6V3_RHIMU
MASKGPKSKLDHDTKTRRQKALEAPREPCRPKTHWDHVLGEMAWLSKDFEKERKWKLAQAKKVAFRASKGMLDQATRGEKKLKEEEQRLRKVALNISKDVKKFWTKIEKLVLYKHQMELDEKKKKALDKQLEFLLGQTERYSTMLAENLVDKPLLQHSPLNHTNSLHKERGENGESGKLHDELLNTVDDDDYDVQSEEESEDDEHTIEEDEALITEEERREELAALRDEIDLPLEELLKRYAVKEVGGNSNDERCENGANLSVEGENHDRANGHPSVSEIDIKRALVAGRCCDENNGPSSTSENDALEVEKGGTRYLSNICGEPAKEHVQYDFIDEQEDGDFVLATGEEKDDETTLSEEDALAKADPENPVDEISLLQMESEIPLEELLARYKKEYSSDEVLEDESEYESALSENPLDSMEQEDIEPEQQETSENGGLDESLSILGPLVENEAGNEGDLEEGRESENRIADAAAAARSAQPTGNTFSTTKVRTKFPFLLKYPLREYQHIGLDWLVTMYEKRLNGILADEMGLGKTIMTIALLAHLACEKGIWGPHLIVVPTSVMLNWETEFLKWCPAFKILTYFGSAKERKFKRQGWMKPNSFHVCITTYRLVIQDSKVFKRKKWKYLILDEAHLIKNWKSQRWQTLLNFNSKRRILLTGTPLQNDLMELWSLMHFLMPHIFQSHQEFKDWFSNPISGMVEGQEKVNKEVVDRLHNVLRPFILRRLKRDVEKQLPMKHEHVVYCRLSRRQRNLYEDFIASSETQATLASANFFGMISIIMQLRKVCNHPDLFEGRPIISSLDMAGIDMQLSSAVCSMLSSSPFSIVSLRNLGLLFTDLDFKMTSWECDEVKAIATPSILIKDHANLDNIDEIGPGSKHQNKLPGTSIFEEIRKAVLEVRLKEAKDRAASVAWWNSLRCHKKPMYSTTLQELLTVKHPVYNIHQQKVARISYLYSSMLADVVISPIERFQKMIDFVESFMFSIPAARAPVPVCWCSKVETSVFLHPTYKEKCSEMLLPLLSPIRPAIVRRQVYFPDRRLIQFDCGKLQELAILLRKLKSEGHRALIFTQMTKMLDILEAFINLYGYTYMRLDGSTQPEERQTLMQRFNTNPKIFLFILSTRSGGVGINLVGADTVIFYDSDWNPAMDQQAQDRCHRIGQTREVHIYRLISESTIEENILKKANQKRALDDLVIQSGGYNTEFFKKLDPMELFSGHKTLSIKNMEEEKNSSDGNEVPVSNADVEAALKYAEDEADYMALKKVEQEEAVDNQEFTEEAIGKLEDDEYVNDDDMKADEPADLEITMYNKEGELNVNDPFEAGALNFVSNGDDADMLADVKQMAAAAAAAGQAISSFENQLRPIDRYAVRFLELWDPMIDKAATESQVRFEETEWELEQIEKYKEEMEAEIDEDEEPLVYERWDADFATEAYRQQVEALTQHQLMEELEAETNEKEAANDTMMNEMPSDPKPKSKKKPKKAKFKSLKKGSLASEMKPAKEEVSMETGSMDDDIVYQEITCADTMSYSSVPRKRKQQDDYMETKPCENGFVDLEQKPASRSKMGGKISITAMPVKRVVTIKPEKVKKGNVWSRDCVPSPDSWLPQEDAILCAVVHEYGPYWNLVSETLYGMTAGGFYRGRYRHPVHCCERYRELIQRYVLSTPENPIIEKTSNMGSGKALLKVTEDNIRMLLNVAAEQPDNELLLQKHFTALLSSVWRTRSSAEHSQNISSSRNGFYFGGRLFSSVNHISWKSIKLPPKRTKLSNFGQGSKLLAAALHDANGGKSDNGLSLANQREDAPVITDCLEITLEFQKEEGDSLILLPPVINLTIPGSEPHISANRDTEDHLRTSTNMAESRFRDAARSCVDDGLGWASSAFPASDVKLRSASLGKHKLSISDSGKPSRSKQKKTSTEHGEICHLFSEPVFQPQHAVSSKDPNLHFDLTPADIQNGWTDDSDSLSNSLLNLEHPIETESLVSVPHEYMPGFISSLDDFSLLPEYTDIG